MNASRADGLSVDRQVYTDPGIFEQELQSIFSTGWVYVAHVGEIPNPDDYVTRLIARQPLIAVRGRSGEVHVLLNSCSHRGNAVCREERGNSRTFRCPYHGWVYGTDGHLVGVTDRTEYSPEFLEQVKGLPAVRSEVYAGLIFASLGGDAPDLPTYLGDVRPYVDLWAEASVGGDPIVHRPHKFSYAGNWKLQFENTADGYHPRFVHESGFKALSPPQPPGEQSSDLFDRAPLGLTKGFAGGHCLFERPPTELDDHESASVRVGITPVSRAARDEYLTALEAKHGSEHARLIPAQRHIGIFPNVYLMDSNIRMIHPVAVDQTIVASHYVELPGAPDELNEARLLDLQMRLGTTGLVGPDDLEMFAAGQTGLRADAGAVLFYRGIEGERTEDGVNVGSVSSETPARAFHDEWAVRIRTPRGEQGSSHRGEAR